MFGWFARRRPAHLDPPTYSDLRRSPTRGFPAPLASMEGSESFKTRQRAIFDDVLRPPQLPAHDQPLFVTLILNEGVVTIPMSDSVQCLVVFTSMIRAADYAQTLLASGPAVRYLSSTPAQFVTMLRDVSDRGITAFAIDRCPRCEEFWTVASRSVETADAAIQLWAIATSTQVARAEFALAHAESSARAGHLLAARDVLLEAIGHITPDDARLHFLLGQVAIARRKQRELQQVKEYLIYLQRQDWADRLQALATSGEPMFTDVSPSLH
jgi:hypothetical protein